MDPPRTTVVGAGGQAAARSWPVEPGPEAPGAPVGQHIGPYRLLELIGEGGFGLVYVAEQQQPVRRRVALKVIKPGMDSAMVAARFEAERQALALMDHPCVARVFDAGTTPFAGGQAGGGRAYFVMEYVPGEPITVFCDRRRYTTRQRLDLFIQVCEAVQHAHQKGVIHRDLKPSNVLVMEQRVGDRDTAIPKVIDFGVAKAISQRLTERTLFTVQGQMVGTPEYMSPEQAAGSTLDIDTRTDVYSLGVLLYELLTGSLPFDAEKMRSAALFEVQRMTRDLAPPRPSVRLSPLGRARPPRGAATPGGAPGEPVAGPGQDSAKIAALRRTDAASLARQLRGDLDWITLRAMDKDRARRYETPTALAADIRRHLASEPVLAGPPSALYRLGKFARRNRVWVAAGTVVFLALVGGLVTAAYGLQRARHEAAAARLAEASERRERARADIARDAEAAQRRSAQESAARAGREAAKALAVSTFLETMLKAADPAISLGRETTVRELLDQAAERINQGEMSGQPEVEGAARSTLGMTYQSLGLAERAEPHLRKALALRTSTLGPEHDDTVSSMNELGMLLDDAGKADEAGDLYRRALEIRRRKDPASADTAVSLGNYATWLHRRARFDEAQSAYAEALEIRKRVLGPEDPATLLTMNNLAELALSRGRPEEAEPISREVLRVRRAILPATHPEITQSINTLAGALMGLQRYAEAEALFRESADLRRRVLGPDHPDLANVLNNVGGSLYLQGRVAEAEQWVRQCMEIQRRSLGASHPQTVLTMRNLARIVEDQGRFDEAETLLLEAYQGAQSGTGMPPTLAQDIAGDLAWIYEQSGRAEKAAEWRALSGRK